jgi:phage repressor protein C with HTH and peptisase S24 domain
MYKDESSDSNRPVIFSETTRGAIPYYGDMPVAAGQAGLNECDNGVEKPTGYMLIPNISAERIFPVIGCSMLPKIKAGDIIGVNRMHQWERVEPDKIYMIVTREDRMLKRLRIDNENEDILWCVSDNYKEFKIDKSDIINIYHVVYHGEFL